MGRIVRDASSASSYPRESNHSGKNEGKVMKSKRRKRKSYLEELHQKIHKAKDALDKTTKAENANGKKSRKTIRTANRILPVTGIYRNGAKGKEIRKAQKKVSLQNLDDARLNSDVFQLVNGDDSQPRNLEKKAADELKLKLSDSDSDDVENNLRISIEDTVPMVQNKNKRQTALDVEKVEPVVLQEKKAEKNQFDTLEAITRYQSLSSSIVADNFQKVIASPENSPDPLPELKSKLRTIYASTFRNKFLRKKIKSGLVYNDSELPSLPTGSSDECYQSWNDSQYSLELKNPEENGRLRVSRIDSTEDGKTEREFKRSQIDTQKKNSQSKLNSLPESKNYEKINTDTLINDIPRTQKKFSEYFKGIKSEKSERRKDLQVPERKFPRNAENFQVFQVSCQSADLKQRESQTEGSYQPVMLRNKKRESIFHVEDVNNCSEGKIAEKIEFFPKNHEKLQLLASNSQKSQISVSNVNCKSVKYMPAILRTKKISQAVKINEMTLKGRQKSRKSEVSVVKAPKEGEIFIDNGDLMPKVVQGHLKTPNEINNMYKSEKNWNSAAINRNPFVSLGYESMQSQESDKVDFNGYKVHPGHSALQSEEKNYRNIIHTKNSFIIPNCLHISEKFLPEEVEGFSICKFSKDFCSESQSFSGRDCDCSLHQCQETEKPVRNLILSQGRVQPVDNVKCHKDFEICDQAMQRRVIYRDVDIPRCSEVNDTLVICQKGLRPYSHVQKVYRPEQKHLSYEQHQNYGPHTQRHELQHQSYEPQTQRHGQQHQSYEPQTQRHGQQHQSCEPQTQRHGQQHQSCEPQTQRHGQQHQSCEPQTQRHELQHQSCEPQTQRHELQHQSYEPQTQRHELQYQSYEPQIQRHEQKHHRPEQHHNYNHPHHTYEQQHNYEQHPHSHSQTKNYYHNTLPDVSILDGVQKMRILSDTVDTSTTTHRTSQKCNDSRVLFRDPQQPIKYLAFEEGMKTRKVPIYPEVEEDRRGSKSCVSTCTKKQTEVIIVPSYKNNEKLICMNPKLVFKDCSHSQINCQSGAGMTKEDETCDGSKTRYVFVRGSSEFGEDIYEARKTSRCIPVQCEKQRLDWKFREQVQQELQKQENSLLRKVNTQRSQQKHC